MTVAELLARLAAAREAGDENEARRLVSLGALWVLEADIDVEFAHDGIYWDAPDETEVAQADTAAARAQADLDALLTDTEIAAEYGDRLQSQEYQAMRAERVREPVEEDDYV